MGFTDFLRKNLIWILIINVALGFLFGHHELLQWFNYYGSKFDKAETRIEKRIEDRNLAITKHFQTSEWVLQDSISTGERGTYLLSTKDGNYIISLNPDGNKVIKSTKQIVKE
ncbi:hypothetical protein SMD22_00450 (plasmid) [Brevibacillus halotolerans]|nr:hypothetical protein SMD22_00450 [Brevibacillus halotolerans]